MNNAQTANLKVKSNQTTKIVTIKIVWYMLCYVFLIIRIVMLCGIIFHCNFFLMIRNLIIMKVVMVPKQKKSQLDLYLKELRLNKKQNSKLEVLSWWKENYNWFPELSLMAWDLMSILITTVTSESSFSTGKKIITSYRSRLLPKNVEVTLCTKSWLYRFKDNLIFL